MTPTPGPDQCGHWNGTQRRYCAAAEQVRRYLIGHRCPAHTPAALRQQKGPSSV